MSMFEMRMSGHMFKTADARYAIGAFVSWPVYGALYIAMLKVFDRYYAVASAISWILSYAIVYAFQKYGTFGAMGREAMLREIAYYAVAVVGLSATFWKQTWVLDRGRDPRRSLQQHQKLGLRGVNAGVQRGGRLWPQPARPMAGNLRKPLRLRSLTATGRRSFECIIDRDDCSPELISWGRQVARANARLPCHNSACAPLGRRSWAGLRLL
jgi:hypothetical protein